ncbi:hypothetical protein QJQ45_016022 [Haematococcus lacustris]|nr:hypothetical protein QJQ45_016022 [Haematococcus lacustris]
MLNPSPPPHCTCPASSPASGSRRRRGGQLGWQQQPQALALAPLTAAHWVGLRGRWRRGGRWRVRWRRGGRTWSWWRTGRAAGAWPCASSPTAMCTHGLCWAGLCGCVWSAPPCSPGRLRPLTCWTLRCRCQSRQGSSPSPHLLHLLSCRWWATPPAALAVRAPLPLPRRPPHPAPARAGWGARQR